MVEPSEKSSDAAAVKVLIDLSVESWRFARVFHRLIGKLDAGEIPRHTSQLRYFLKKVEDGLDGLRLRIVSLEGQRYDPGMAASALNIADFGPDDFLVVDQMVEPLIMGPEGVVRAGTIMLAKVQP